MARIKIITPEKIIDTINIPVRIGDINYGNHLGNDSLVSIIHEARIKWLSKNGYSELNIGGCGTIMNELAVNYLNESFYGDTLIIQISIGEISTSSFELYYNITTLRADKELKVAKAKTGMVCYDYENKKIAAVPNAFLSLIEN
jgi:acyl-CoA thioesterase FadM